MGYNRLVVALSLWTVSLLLAPPRFLPTYSQWIQDSLSQAFIPSDDSRPSKWAYVYVVAGMDPDKPTYRGFLYNIAISAHIFQLQGSRADVVVLLQLDRQHEKLPAEDELLLNASNIRIKYLPPMGPEKSFFQINLQKFETLRLTEYSRVLYLDSDIMPFCNLDYLFELSEQGYLKENVVMATYGEPANGGFFLTTPREGDWQRLQQVIIDTSIRTVEAGAFNYTRGWGHVMGESSHDVARMTNHRNVSIWYWYASNADQGLLYQWMKYEQKEVSMIIADEVEHWSRSSDNGRLQFEGTYPLALNNYTCLPPGSNQEGRYAHSVTKDFDPSAWVPYRDFRHFWGKLKPWNILEGSGMTIEEMIRNKTDSFESPWEARDANEFWWSMLKEVQESQQLSLPRIEFPGKQPRNATRIPTGHWYTVNQMRNYLNSLNVSYRELDFIH
jgi:hypothetical protein